MLKEKFFSCICLLQSSTRLRIWINTNQLIQTAKWLWEKCFFISKGEMMKANPISSGLVNFTFMFALWGLFSFLHPLVLLLHLKKQQKKKLSCMRCHENPACVNHRKCCMIGECNCACMPAQNPFGRFDLFLCAPPVFSWIDFSLWIPFKCFFPSYTFFGAHLYLFPFCIVVCWCVFYFFFPFGSVTCPELAFVWKTRVIFSWLICLCDSCFFFFFFFQVMLLSWLAECKCKCTMKKKKQNRKK